MKSTIFKVNKELSIPTLLQKLQSIGCSAEVQVESVGNLKSILVEKYFMRNSNVACCSVCIYSHAIDQHDVIVISGGSSQGVFIKLSWGADSEFLETVVNCIKSI